MLSSVATLASAQSSVTDPIVVTAERTGEALQTDVIEEDEIELLQPVTALDLIDRIAGVRAFEKGGPGGRSYLSIRGGEPNFTLVLLDGIKVNNPTNSGGGAFDFGQIDPLALERIEVAKGALSAVHGADALAGVVQLQLRRFEAGEELLAGRITGDTEAGFGAAATLGTGWANGDALFSASYYNAGDLVESSNAERLQVFGRGNQRVGGLAVNALLLHSNTDRSSFPEDSGGPRLAVVRELESRKTDLTVIGLGLERAGSPRWRPRLSVGWTRQDEESDTPAIAPGAVIGGVPALAADSRFDRVEITFENRLKLAEIVEVAAGANWLRESGEAEGTIDFGALIPTDFAIDRELWGLFAEATVHPLPWARVTAGLRYDDPSSADPEWTGRIAVRAQPISHGPALFASWAEGYKLPSLFALAFPLIANPDLLPERSETFEFGLEQGFADGLGRVAVSYFHNSYTDLIDFDPQLFTNINRSKVTAQGVEADLALPLSPSLALIGNVTYLDTDQPADALPLRARPEWTWLTALEWRPDDRTQVQLGAQHVGEFFDSSVPTGLLRLDERTEVTAALSYRFSDRISGTIAARNLFDADFEEAIGFPAPGRVIRATLTFRGGRADRN